MTKREDMEFAAKAAGRVGFVRDLPFSFIDTGNGYIAWNPRDDSADSFSLMVERNLQVTFDSFDGGPVVKVSIPYDHPSFDSNFYWVEYLLKDPEAATRLAIFRAAVAIGKDMK